jgi:hypothetical protein
VTDFQDSGPTYPIATLQTSRKRHDPYSFQTPAIGKYIQPEPEWDNPRGLIAGMFRGKQPLAYRYGENNPVNTTDRSGRWPGGDNSGSSSGSWDGWINSTSQAAAQGDSTAQEQLNVTLGMGGAALIGAGGTIIAMDAAASAAAAEAAAAAASAAATAAANLRNVINAIQEGYENLGSSPTQQEVLNMIAEAAESVGLQKGRQVPGMCGSVDLINKGGVVTTIGQDAQVVISQGDQILLWLSKQ